MLMVQSNYSVLKLSKSGKALEWILKTQVSSGILEPKSAFRAYYTKIKVKAIHKQTRVELTTSNQTKTNRRQIGDYRFLSIHASQS